MSGGPDPDTRPHPVRDHQDVDLPVPDPGRELWPSWDICRWCRVQLYTDPALDLATAGHFVPRLNRHQVTCPAADNVGQGHDTDEADNRPRRRRLGCGALIAIDGPDRARILCPYRAVRRVTWSPGSPAAQRREQGCHLHFPDLLSRADREVRAGQQAHRVGVTAASVTDIVYERTTRETGHGRPGRWVEVANDGPTQHQLF
ncbi:MAG: hypothetical protein L0I76_19910 [Pseudonocardia sp.]|nr:hypothetical protein [Pseudonocardia sp.]